MRHALLLALVVTGRLGAADLAGAERPELPAPQPALLEVTADGTPLDSAPTAGQATAEAPVTTRLPARAGVGAPATVAAEVAPGAPAGGEAGSMAEWQVTTPRRTVRYEAPVGPAPRVGYAPQAGQPLPGYPGFPAVTGQVGYPAALEPAGGAPAVGQLGSLYTDLKASRPGDVLTIVITQQAIAAANADKNSGRDVGMSFQGGTGLLSFLPKFSAKYEGESKGSTKDTSSFNIATTFTVTVTERLPNGNLRVEGRQNVVMDGKDQWVQLTGEIRPYDVRPDNTIDSTRVANVAIEFVGARAPKKQKGFLAVVGGAIESLFGWLF